MRPGSSTRCCSSLARTSRLTNKTRSPNVSVRSSFSQRQFPILERTANRNPIHKQIRSSRSGATYGYHVEPVPLRPLVKVHPETGRPNLLIGRHAHDIVGMDPAQSEALLDKLNDEACQAPRTYHHQWEVGDAVIWDNRRLMHRGTPFDMTQPRRMWHTRIAGEPVSELAVNHLHELEATT